jgi:hypothetical protein
MSVCGNKTPAVAESFAADVINGLFICRGGAEEYFADISSLKHNVRIIYMI